MKWPLFLFLFLIACNETQDDYPIEINASDVAVFVPGIDCHPEELIIESNFSECTVSAIAQSEVDTLNYPIRLNQAWSFFPMFCLNVPERIYFQSTQGEFQAFELFRKNWYWVDRFKTIESTVGQKEKHICYKAETAFLQFKSLNKEHFIALYAASFFDIKNQDTLTPNQISISQFSFEDFDPTDNEGLFYRVYSDTVYDNCVETIPSWQINDQEFKNVCKGPEKTGDIKIIYQNDDYGFIGFEDNKGVLWALEI